MTTETVHDIDGWQVTATWGDATRPIRLVIERGPNASGRERGRGLNTGAMRRIEQALNAVVGPLSTDEPPWLDDAVTNLATIDRPTRGRGSSSLGYYTAILAIYERLEREVAAPAAMLAERMAMNPSTLKSQLQRARVMREHGR